MIQQFWKEEKRIKSLFVVDFFLYFCTFLLVPIIPIYMKDFLNFNSSQVGLTIGIPSVIGCFFGGISYLCYKKFGSYLSILLSICIDIIVYMFLFLKGDFYLIFLIYIFKGFSGCIFMPIFKNLYINALEKKENKVFVFKIRYILICTSAIFAPLVSNYLYPVSEKLIFIIVIAINVICSFIILTKKNLINSIEVHSNSIIPLKKIILQKKYFFIFLIACIGILSVFSQFEGTFILTLDDSIALNMFSKLLILNSILGIIFQVFHMQFFKKISSYHSIIIGCLFFSSSYFSFFISKNSIVSLSFSILLFTLGETLVLPNIEIFTTEISSENERVIFYSLLEFKRLGFFLGPFLSGIILANFSPAFMFLFFSSLSIFSCCIFMYFKYKYFP